MGLPDTSRHGEVWFLYFPYRIEGTMPEPSNPPLTRRAIDGADRLAAVRAKVGTTGTSQRLRHGLDVQLAARYEVVLGRRRATQRFPHG